MATDVRYTFSNPTTDPLRPNCWTYAILAHTRIWRLAGWWPSVIEAIRDKDRTRDRVGDRKEGETSVKRDEYRE